ncbi:MAG: outer membrane beta-barrel protein [Rhodopila sp.]
MTVQSRLHPELAAPGMRFHALQIFPTLDVSSGYDRNVLGNAGGGARRGSWVVTTTPGVTATTDWSRDQLGASISLQSAQYLSMPNQNQVNGTVAAGGRLDVGRDQLTVAAAHSAQHEILGGINTIASTSPIAFQIDDIRAAYTLVNGRWNLTPALGASSWTYGDATINGVTSAQSYRDRLVTQGSMTLRYEWAPLRNILFVMRALGQDYTHIPFGQPTTNSQSFQALAGVDYDDNALWRLRLLLGGESRHYAASVYHPQNTFIIEAEATWFPTQLTTLRATLTRDTEDAAQEGISGLVYAAARIAIDHELRRDLLLRAYGELQQASYFGDGRQTGFVAGFGVTWSLNRYARLSLTYDQSDLSGGRSGSQNLSTGYKNLYAK